MTPWQSCQVSWCAMWVGRISNPSDVSWADWKSVVRPVCLSRRVLPDVPTPVDRSAVGLSIGALRLVINRTLGEADGHFLQRNISRRAGASAGTNAGNDAVVEYVRIVNQLG